MNPLFPFSQRFLKKPGVKDKLSHEIAAEPAAYTAKLDEIVGAEEKAGRKIFRSAAELCQHVAESERQDTEASALALNDKPVGKNN